MFEKLICKVRVVSVLPWQWWVSSLSCWLPPAPTAFPGSSVRIADWKPAPGKNNAHQGMIIALSAWRDCEVIGKPPAFWVPDARLPEPTLGCCFFHLLSCLPDFSFVLATETQMLYSLQKVSPAEVDPLYSSPLCSCLVPALGY